MTNLTNNLRSSNEQTRYLLGSFYVFLGACGFSAKAVFIKLAYRVTAIDSLSLLTIRMVFSLPFYIVIAYLLSKHPDNVKLNRANWLWIGVLGMLGYYVSSLLDFMGLQYVTASVERLILFVYPTMVLVITAVFFHQKIKKIQYFALLLTYAGIACAFLDDVKASEQKNLWLGAILIFICSFTYAVYLVGAGKLITQVGPIKFTCYAMMAAGVGVFTHFLLTQNVSHLWNYPTKIYWLGLLMALFATVIPTFLVSQGIKLIGSDNASIIGSIGPVITIFMAYVFLGESITLFELVGTTFVMIGVLMISVKGKTQQN